MLQQAWAKLPHAETTGAVSESHANLDPLIIFTLGIPQSGALTSKRCTVGKRVEGGNDGGTLSRLPPIA